ncbi:hypothetical protein ACROYT_G019092 [Oculina patagonica]
MSGFLFLLALDWIMREAIADRRRGMRWNFATVLEDLDLTSHYYHKSLSPCTRESIVEYGEELEDVEEFAYLGDKEGGGSKDIMNRHQQTCGAFQRLWKMAGINEEGGTGWDTVSTGEWVWTTVLQHRDGRQKVEGREKDQRLLGEGPVEKERNKAGWASCEVANAVARNRECWSEKLADFCAYWRVEM